MQKADNAHRKSLMDHAEHYRPANPIPIENPAMDEAVHLRKVRRKAIFAYAYLATPGIALLGFALYDAVTASRWLIFIGLFVALGAFWFYLPLVTHFRCANCKRFFHNERMALENDETVYRCVACGHGFRERELCGMTDMVKSSRCLVRVKPPERIQKIEQPRPRQ